ncbi:MAG TPA: UDP-N-acetylglucosamine 1-carboxyvinyltransferase [Acidobacteriota bacterium]|nr:UDP-N-acetylglucosamine 1-carboxyvinyltransferase [Acidobacteriota bacterium]
MEKLRIRGGQRLSGRVPISGAKNAALPALAATLLSDDETRLENVPAVRDVDTTCRLLHQLGSEVARPEPGVVVARSAATPASEASYDLVKTMRASFLVLGPLLARTGRARVSLPGGCAIGARPVDRHLAGLTRLGAALELDQGYVEARCTRLRGAEIVFDVVTVGGTENCMMAATLATGTTVLRNAAAEPEVTDLADLLIAMGAHINGAGTDTIEIEGVASLHSAHHSIIPDRIETGTYLVAGALVGDGLEIVGCRPEHLGAVIDRLTAAGVDVHVDNDHIAVSRGDLHPVDLQTQPYPGFPTDMQAQFMVLTSQAGGRSVIRENIFENRFMHVPELSRMGADIRIDGRNAIVSGPTPLTGATVMATDLRASASLMLAGLLADGETVIDRLYHLDRGYGNLVSKLAAAGAEVERFRE